MSYLVLDRVNWSSLWEKNIEENITLTEKGLLYSRSFKEGTRKVPMSERHPEFGTRSVPQRKIETGLIDEISGQLKPLWEPRDSEKNGRVLTIVSSTHFKSLSMVFEPEIIGTMITGRTKCIASLLDLSNGEVLPVKEWWSESQGSGVRSGRFEADGMFFITLPKDKESEHFFISSVEIDTGQLKWETEALLIDYSPIFAGANKKIVLIYGEVKSQGDSYTLWYGIDATNGKPLWKKWAKSPDPLFVSPRQGIWTEMVGQILLIGKGSLLVIVDGLTGEIINQQKEFPAVSSDSHAVYKDTLILGTYAGVRAYELNKQRNNVSDSSPNLTKSDKMTKTPSLTSDTTKSKDVIQNQTEIIKEMPIEGKILIKLLDPETVTVAVGRDNKILHLVKDEILIKKGVEIMQQIVNALPEPTKQRIGEWRFGVIPGKGSFGDGKNAIVVGEEVLKRHSKDAIAYVISHEIAHCTLEHKLELLKLSPMERIVASPSFPDQKLFREQELAADKFGTIYMLRACFKIDGAIEFINNMGMGSEFIGHLPWADSPSPSDKLAVVKEQANSLTASSVQITSNVQIFPYSASYNTGDSIIANFTINNIGGSCIFFDVLTVGGRLNGECPEGQCPDFEFAKDISLAAGQSCTYNGKLTLLRPGKYHFFPTYKTQDASWNTSIPTAYNIVSTKDIEVEQQHKTNAESQLNKKEEATKQIINTVFDQLLKKRK